MANFRKVKLYSLDFCVNRDQELSKLVLLEIRFPNTIFQTCEYGYRVLLGGPSITVYFLLRDCSLFMPKGGPVFRVGG